MWQDFLEDMKETNKRCFLGAKPLCHDVALITSRACACCYENWHRERGN